MQHRFEDIKNNFLPRFWDTEKKEMIYPYWNDYSNTILYPYDKSTENDTCDDWDNMDLSDILMSNRFIRMKPTCLKDKNEKLLYEGDVAKESIYGANGVVVYNYNGYVLHLADGSFYPIYTTSVEIIGNIYDNPELLGDGK